MPNSRSDTRYLFPRWANYLLPALIVASLGGVVYVPLVVGLGGSPATTTVGYQPTQPVPFSHRVHVGQLGMDCRYCHTTVERAAYAAIPPTQTCMNCHLNITADSPRMLRVNESYATGQPIEWIKVHNLPDYVYFNHGAHVNAGVGCVSCHGRIDRMEIVYQAESLSMGWCLDCHREPEKHLRPREVVTQLDWMPPEDQFRTGLRLKEEYNIRDAAYLTDCSVCHR